VIKTYNFSIIYRFNGGRSSVGRAPDCDSGGRGFNPRRPPHLTVYKSITYSANRQKITF
jgi:hypothetical protein